ncbi:MAG: hypothetical protein DMG96_17355 [Acidobacteria bacterium]|nr:MAG: hypothetical protein DMG96_17355 [Acidobacteriota bacterium]
MRNCDRCGNNFKEPSLSLQIAVGLFLESEVDTIVWILIWLGLSLVVGEFAHRKGKSAAVWMVVSVLISPLIAFVILSVSESSDYRTCPFCAEKIKAAAKVCRYCRHSLQPV